MSGLSVKYFIYQCDCESLQLYTECVGFVYDSTHAIALSEQVFMTFLRMQSLPAGITTALVLSSWLDFLAGVRNAWWFMRAR